MEKIMVIIGLWFKQTLRAGCYRSDSLTREESRITVEAVTDKIGIGVRSVYCGTIKRNRLQY